VTENYYYHYYNNNIISTESNFASMKVAVWRKTVILMDHIKMTPKAVRGRRHSRPSGRLQGFWPAIDGD